MYNIVAATESELCCLLSRFGFEFARCKLPNNNYDIQKAFKTYLFHNITAYRGQLQEYFY